MLLTSVHIMNVMPCSGAVAYIGGNWDRDIAFAGYAVPLQVHRALQNLSQPHRTQHWLYLLEQCDFESLSLALWCRTGGR